MLENCHLCEFKRHFIQKYIQILLDEQKKEVESFVESNLYGCYTCRVKLV